MFCGILIVLMTMSAAAIGDDEPTDAAARFSGPPFDVLTPAQQDNVEHSIDRGLTFLAASRKDDGSFAARDTGQPGITALAVMAFLSKGDMPGQGPHGESPVRAIDYVIDCQRKDGMLSLVEPEPGHVHDGASHAGNYNHAIAGLMLGEACGMCDDHQNERIREAIEPALKFMRQQQVRPKRSPLDHGGVRYMRLRSVTCG